MRANLAAGSRRWLCRSTAAAAPAQRQRRRRRRRRRRAADAYTHKCWRATGSFRRPTGIGTAFVASERRTRAQSRRRVFKVTGSLARCVSPNGLPAGGEPLGASVAQPPRAKAQSSRSEAAGTVAVVVVAVVDVVVVVAVVERQPPRRANPSRWLRAREQASLFVWRNLARVFASGSGLSDCCSGRSRQ